MRILLELIEEGGKALYFTPSVCKVPGNFKSFTCIKILTIIYFYHTLQHRNLYKNITLIPYIP